MNIRIRNYLRHLFKLFKVYLKFSLIGVSLALAYGVFTGPLSIESEWFPYSWITVVCIGVIIVAVREIHLEEAKHKHS